MRTLERTRNNESFNVFAGIRRNFIGRGHRTPPPLILEQDFPSPPSPAGRPLRPAPAAGRQGIHPAGTLRPSSPGHADSGRPDPGHRGHGLVRRRRSSGRGRRHRLRAGGARPRCLADRLGQRPVLLFAAIFNTAAVVALILTAYLVPVRPGPGGRSTRPCRGFRGRSELPQVGPLARVRWMALTARGSKAGNAQDLDAALSYESTADELTFVLGPALVGILASLIAPWLPLALAAALTITLVPAFAVHRTHRAVPLSVRRRRGAAAQACRLRARSAGSPAAGIRGAGMAAVALPVLAMVCMGTFFGSTQTGLSSFSASFATAEIAGLLYAVMGLSSAAAALSVAYWPQRFTLSARWMVSAVLMAGLAVLLLLPGLGAADGTGAAGPGTAGGPADGHRVRHRRGGGSCRAAGNGHDSPGQRHCRRHGPGVLHCRAAGAAPGVFRGFPRTGVRRSGAVPARGGRRRRHPPAPEGDAGSRRVGPPARRRYSSCFSMRAALVVRAAATSAGSCVERI